MNFKTLFFLCFAYNAIAANIPYDGDKVRVWAGSTHSNAIINIERYIRVILEKIPQNVPTKGSFNKSLSKLCHGKTTSNLDPNIEILRTWPKAGGNCAQKQYDLVMQALAQYDAQQLIDKDAEIASLRIVIQMLRDLNRRLKVEIANLNLFIENELEDMIKRYVRYVERSDKALDAHSVGLIGHTAELERLLGLVQHGNGTSGLLHDIQNAQTEAERLLAEAETASGETLEALAQKVRDLRSIITDTDAVFKSYKQQIDVLTQAMGASTP